MEEAALEQAYTLDDLVLRKSRFNLNWIKELNIDPKVIFDIGSYDCGDGIRFKIKYPSAEVYSFEGCPERQKIIESYIDNYDINLVKNAITDYTGLTNWYSAICIHKHKPMEPYAAQGSIYKHSDIYKKVYRHVRQHKKTQVQCTSVEDFAKLNNIEKIDIAHIDVEGAEYEVIAGFGILRPTLVYVETINSAPLWTGSKGVIEIHESLTSLGYSLILDISSDRLYRYEN